MMSSTRLTSLLACFLFLGACSGGRDEAPAAPSDAGTDAGPPGLALFGFGTHEPSTLEVTVIASEDQGLWEPRDIAFSPAADHQLWVLNADSAMVIISATGTPEQRHVRKREAGYEHFLPSPSALAFGDATMATAHETDDVTQSSTPIDFMGPSLWPLDAALYNGGHASHLDMLHNSPNAVGIAWESGNAYWVFDGYHRSLTFYDFAADHGPGGEDHSDGIILRYVEGQVGYVDGVASHLEMDRASGLLYVADTGNNRVAVLDTRTGARGEILEPNYDDADMFHMTSAPLTTLVDGAAYGMVQPSGLALRGGLIYVADRALSVVHAFDLTGAQIDWLDLSSQITPGALGAVELDAEGRLYVTDIGAHRVLRIAPRAL